MTFFLPVLQETSIVLGEVKEASALDAEPQLTDAEIYLGLSEGAKKLPTDKFHISYSELVDWLECSHRHKLKHVQKIGGDTGSQHTEYGKIIHDAIEQWLTGTPFDAEKTKLDIIEGLKKYPDFKGDPVVWGDSVKPIFDELPKFLTDKLGDYKVVAAELALMEPIEKKKDRWFKGFVDAFFEYTYYDKRMKNPEPQKRYLVCDWKSSDWGWTGEKKRDPMKAMQLVLYKHYISKKFNIPLEQIKCAFVILKRTAKPGAHIELIPVSVGEKAIENALQNVWKMIGSVERNMVIKNRSSCKWCVYAGTEFCT